MTTRTTITITKEINNIKSVELLSYGTSRKDVYVNDKKVSNSQRKEALVTLQGDVKTTTSTKTYAIGSETILLNEDIKVENDAYMSLVMQAIEGYKNSKYNQ